MHVRETMMTVPLHSGDMRNGEKSKLQSIGDTSHMIRFSQLVVYVFEIRIPCIQPESAPILHSQFELMSSKLSSAHLEEGP